MRQHRAKVRGNILIRRKNDDFLKGSDVSACPRCGEFADIVHIFDRDKDANDLVTGFACCRCLYATGDANIFTAISARRWIRKIKKSY